MTIQLLSVLSAAALAVGGMGTLPAETRSTQALPAQHLALAQSAADAGKARAVRHLADADADKTDRGSCSKDDEQGDHQDRKCKAAAWWAGSGARVPILLATAAGIAFAVGESGGSSTDGSGGSVSH